jgi:hypothetical protein
MNPPASGPATIATAMIPANMPWYRPRSRGETRSPMIAMTPTTRPPAPSPCRARKPINMSMLVDMPDNAEPTRKITIDAMKMFLRP